MSTLVQFWAADGPNGEVLIREYKAKVLQCLADAATARPERCVLVLLQDTRNNQPGGRTVELWRKPRYVSGTGEGPGLLNMWKAYI